MTYAARAAKCHERTASRGWHHGWIAGQSPLPWAHPIKKVLEAEADEGRRAAMAEERAKMEATAARRKESEEVGAKAWAEVEQMLRFHRNAVTRIAGTAVVLSQSCYKVVPVAAAKLEAMASDPNVTARQLLGAIGSATLMLERLSKAVSAHVAAEKLFHNEPTAKTQTDDISELLPLDEGIARIDAAKQALESLKAGHLVVIQGGLSAKPDETPARAPDEMMNGGASSSTAEGGE